MSETWRPNPEMSERLKVPAAKQEERSDNRNDTRSQQFSQKIETLRNQLLEGGGPTEAAANLWEKLTEWQERLERPGYYDFDQTSERIVQQLTGQTDTDIMSWSDIIDYQPNQSWLDTMTDREKNIMRKTVDSLICERTADLEQRVTTDYLCRDLYNRRYFESLFLHEAARVKKIDALTAEELDGKDDAEDNQEKLINRGKSFVIVFDINNFSKYNNEHSHLHGDYVLMGIAKVMRQMFRRQSDVLARVGGDEFALITRSHTEENLIGFLQKFLGAVSEQGIEIKMPGADPLQQKIDIGLGVSEILPGDSKELEESWQCAYHRADLAAKIAKDMTKKGIDGKPFRGTVISTPNQEKKRTKHHHHNFLDKTHA